MKNIDIEDAEIHNILSIDILVETVDGREARICFDNFDDWKGLDFSIDVDDVDYDEDGVPPFTCDAKYRMSFDVYFDSFKEMNDDLRESLGYEGTD